MSSAAQQPRSRLEQIALRLQELTLAEEQAPVERRRLARDTLQHHAPEAARRGWHDLRCELEDSAFRLLAPQEHARLVGLLGRTREARLHNLECMVREIGAHLRAGGIHAEVHGRAKHLFGIWRKMRRKGLDFRYIHDVRALRIITASSTDCYRALHVVHRLWRPLPEEFDDYIASPKPNGYRSLHTAVVRPDGRTAEVQIRTREMHRASVEGAVAHWRYKEQLRREHPLTGLREVA